MAQEHHHIGGPGIGKHGHHGHQHQNRAQKRVEKEFERRIDPLFSTPNPNDQKHRDQTGLKKHVKKQQIQSAEHPDHQAFKHQKGNHIFFETMRDIPRGRDDQGHRESGQQNKQKAYSINPHLILHAQEPAALFDELKARIIWLKTRQQHKRGKKGKSGRSQRQIFHVSFRGFTVPPGQKRQDDRCNQRDECN